jgi:hypothetical protein
MTRATLSILLVSSLMLWAAGCSDDAAVPDAMHDAPVDASVEPDASTNPCHLKPDGTPCGDQTDSDCDHPNMCVSGYCYANFEIAGRQCGDATTSECDRADTCDGSGVCSPNYVLAGTLCGGGPTDECTLETTCNGAGACEGPFAPAGTPCGGEPFDCWEQALCDGAGTCEVFYSAAGTPCGDPSNTTCTDPDTCDGAGECLANSELDGLFCNDCSAGPGGCAGCANGVCANICQAEMLLTTFADNNGSTGAMFDVRALNRVEIRSFDGNLPAGTRIMEIYYRPGPYLGHETNASSWTLLGNVSVVSSGVGVPTPIPIDVQVVIPAGETYAFYVTGITGTALRYTTGTAVGAVYASDGNIEFLQGIGKSYPFGSTFTPRIFNGNIHYDVPPCEGVVMPDAGVPDADVPDADVPDAAAPDAAAPDAAAPDAAAPDAAVPDAGGLPDASTSDASTSDAVVVDSALPADSSGLPDAITTD